MFGIFHQPGAPILVYQRPGDDRGVVAVAIEDAHHGLAHPPRRVRGEALDIGDFGPDQQAKAVGHIIVARVRHLDVAAQRIEAQLDGLFGLVFEKFDGRRRVDAIGVIILVQRAAHIDGLAVEQDLAIGRGDGAEAKGFLDHIDTAIEGYCKGIKVGLADIPELDAGHFERHANRFSRRQIGGGDNDAFAVADLQLGRQALGRGGEGEIGPKHTIHAGLNDHMVKAAGIAGEQRDRLPQPANSAIPGDLAMRDFGEGKFRESGLIGRGHGDPHLDFIGWPQPCVFDGKFEGQEGAFVAAQLFAVEEDLAGIADGTEMQRQIPIFPAGRQGEAALVGGVAEGIDQVGKLGLPGLGHMRLAPGPVLMPELPDAIQ